MHPSSYTTGLFRRGKGTDHLAPPGAFGLLDSERQAPAGVVRHLRHEARPRAPGRSPRSGRRRAARARPGRRGACAAARRPRRRRPSRDARGRRLLAPRALVNTGPCERGATGGRSPGRSARSSSARAARRTSFGDLRRTSTCSRSPDSSRVEPRGGIAWSSRTITLSSASRGRPRSRTRRPRSRRRRPDRVLDHLGAEAAHRARLDERGGSAGSSVVTPRRRASGSNVEPCSERREQHREEDDVEELDAPGDVLDHREGGEHHRHGAAQARPTPRTVRSGQLKRAPDGREHRARAGARRTSSRARAACP